MSRKEIRKKIINSIRMSVKLANKREDTKNVHSNFATAKGMLLYELGLITSKEEDWLHEIIERNIN